MSENILQKFRDKFIEEANSLLDKLEKDLLELETDPENKELLESAFRAMHTLKGVSGMYGFEYIAEFTHVLENIYQSLRDKKIMFNKDIYNLSFESIDHIRKLLDDEKLTVDINKSVHKVLLEKINAIALIQPISKTTPTTPEPIKEPVKAKQSWYIILHTNEQIFFRGISLTNIFKELSQLGEYHIQQIPVLSNEENDSWGIVLVSDCSILDIQEVFMFIEDDCQIFRITKDNIFEPTDTRSKVSPPQQQQTYTYEPEPIEPVLDLTTNINTEDSKLTDQTATPNEPAVAKPMFVKQNLKRISVDAFKLDHLMYLVSELITVNSQILLAAKNRKHEELRPYIESIDTLSKKFRNNALEIRLVPLNDIALRFQRLVRDLSHSLNKKVNFITEGADTELDKNTIDIIAEPLMHIIRNCLDHGIESPEKRLSIGKPETGTIKISATQSGNYININIDDDGNGIDPEKVRRKAVEKGIISDTYKPSEKEIFDYLFLPGFSTANTLSEVSGRGVGMDVVKKTITDLRGDITIHSILGQGTTMAIKLQQSVAIVDTLLFVVEKTFLIIPMSEIEICIQEPANYLQQRRNTGTIPYNNQLIHFYDLRQHLSLEGEFKDNVKILIIKKNDTYIALLADNIIGEHQAVLKPLGKALQDHKLFMSASQLGDGNLAFMLDTAVLNSK